MNFVKLKMDVVFKMFFARNIDLLRDFLSVILNIPCEKLKDIYVINSELPPDYENGKFCRLDLLVRVGEVIINIEMQVRNEGYYTKRTFLYWAKCYESTLKSGEDYSKLKKCISINILDFNLFDGKTYHHCFIPYDVKEKKGLFDEMEVHFLQLKKVNPKPDANDMKQVWLNLINAETKEDFEMIKNMNIPVMNKAIDVLFAMSNDEEVREMVRVREKMLHDEATAKRISEEKGIEIGRVEGIEIGRVEGIKIGEEKGIKIGEEKGRVEERMLMMERMRRKGYTEQQILELFGEGL